MNIAFFINNENLKDLDLTQIERGNPGIGGTQYIILKIALALSKNFENNKISLFAKYTNLLPHDLDKKEVLDLPDAIKQAKINNFDYIVFKPENFENLDKTIRDLKQKCITWAHNFYDFNIANLISNNSYIVKNVFVGKNQFIRYIDHDLIKKSTYIYNPITIENLNSNFNRFNNINITYLGSLIESKGFYVLAKQWSKIKRNYPDAILNVIGSGQVHSRNIKLGKLQIAEENYEKKLLNYVSKNGKLLSSIRFHGILGAEKNKIISQTTVGVVNPTGRTETFGLSVSEFNVQNVPVVSKKTNGLVDTLINNMNGLNYIFEKNLHKKLRILINNKKLNTKLGIQGHEFVKNNFNLEKILNEWIKLFKNLNNDEPTLKVTHFDDKYIFVNYNFLRFINSRLRNFPFLKKLPPICFYEDNIKRVLRSFKK
jgi:glycosyltransferase involved in cell wall biosynthesis